MTDTTLDPYKNEPAVFLFTAKDNRGREGSFDYYRASNGMVFIKSVPHDLADYYELGFQPIPADEAGLAQAAKAEAFKIEQLSRYARTGKYLEIGPWIGMAAYNALKAGFDVTTFEMNRDCVNLMRQSGIDAIQTDDPAQTLVERAETYDVIAMWHSIEHVPAPWTLLDGAMKALRPGGVLLVATPNPESAQARAHGKRWFHLDAPRHLHLLPMSMVEDIARQNGLIVVERTTDDQLGVHLDRQGWEWPFLKRALKLPAMRRQTAWIAAAAGALQARKRRKGDLDGAAYTIIMARPRQS